MQKSPNGMSDKSPKGSLPFGWVVKTSKHYPDKVYYFNIYTGDSTWECPELDPPRALTDKDKNVDAMHSKDKKEAHSPQARIIETKDNPLPLRESDSSRKSPPPPTAIVMPVGHEQKSPKIPIAKKVKFKRKSDSVEENSHSESEPQSKSNSPRKKKKSISPLNKPDIDESSIHVSKEGLKFPSVEVLENTFTKDTGISEMNDSCISDIEMRDVSLEVLNDLSEKKDAVYDPDACYYIVVDTNVLVRELNLINELKDTPLDGCGPPHIFIPWVVIEELDKLKTQRIPKVSSGACEAIRYLNTVLRKHPRFHGQSPADAEEWAKTYSKCNDDRILECCMGLSDKMPLEKIILLTNDKNLANKATILDVNVHTFESMMKKVKPDTNFNLQELRERRMIRAKKNNEKDKEVEKISSDSVEVEKKNLTSKRDLCKREIHSIMSSARLVLKDVLLIFLAEEMLEAFGKIWEGFQIEKKLLKGVIEGVLKYWRTVFFEFFTEKDKRNFELLLEKAKRPEGFFGDKDECLVILSTIEEIFRQIRKRRPNLLNIPVEQIQDYRVACVNAFDVFNDAETSFRQAEDESIATLLNDNWTAINQMCGIIMDHYKIPHDFDYYGNEKRYVDAEIQRILVIVYPAVEEIKNLLCKIYDNVKSSQPVQSYVKRLAQAFLNFIPSVKLPHEPLSYPFFSSKAFERWITSPQNRQKLEIGVEQIKKFFSKLDEALKYIIDPFFIQKMKEEQEMICD